MVPRMKPGVSFLQGNGLTLSYLLQSFPFSNHVARAARAYRDGSQMGKGKNSTPQGYPRLNPGQSVDSLD